MSYPQLSSEPIFKHTTTARLNDQTYTDTGIETMGHDNRGSTIIFPKPLVRLRVSADIGRRWGVRLRCCELAARGLLAEPAK